MLTDAIKNTSKNIDKFVCVICDFTCSKKGDYNRHLTTRKHIKLTDKLTLAANGITSDKYFCNCGSFFSHKSSLSRHKKKCILIKNDNNDSEKEVKMKDTVSMEQFVDVVNKCVQLSEDNKVLTEKVVELAKEPKVVNNTQNINNNVFNLNVFLNEDCKDALNLTDFVQNLKLQLEDLENMGKLGYVEGMSNIIITELNNLEKEIEMLNISVLGLNNKIHDSSEAFDNEDKANVLVCGQMNDAKLSQLGIFKPDHYIILDFLGDHYRIITYKNKRILTFDEIPFDLKRLILKKILSNLLMKIFVC